VTGERWRSVALYGCAALLLAGGGAWWFLAAPPSQQKRDERLVTWRASAERLLPDMDSQDDGDMIELPAGVDHEVVSDVGEGEFLVSVVCVGEADSQVRVSMGEVGADSGRGLSCSADQPPDVFTVSSAGQLRMHVSVGAVGPIVFRYSLLHTGN
jgi:hypothetical protein